MDKEHRSASSGFGGNGLVAVLVLATGAWVLRVVPLEGTRPPVDEPKVEQRFAEQDVDARLWQDPFGAVARSREDSANKPGATRTLVQEDDLHSEERLRNSIAKKKTADGVKEVAVMAVMLPGGPYAEYVEGRRRTRYAVLAGLNASNYAPVDTEHLGYYLPVDKGEPRRKLPQTVPYEWFEPAADMRRADTVPRQVLVLWVDNSAFYDDPFAHFKQLFSGLTPKEGPKPTLHWRVIGPVGSDGLRAMLDEASQPNVDKTPDAAAKSSFDTKLFADMDVRFVSPAATVSDRALLDSWARRSLTKPEPGQTLPGLLAGKGITLLRSIGDDHQLAKSLVQELKLRGLKADSDPKPSGDEGTRREAYNKMCRGDGPPVRTPDHIAVVAEWDTLYGRSLRRQFMIDADDDEGFCVTRYNYVRGLDGQLPVRGNAAPAASTGSKEAASGKDDSRRQDGSFIERAEGQSQYDYLRRLAGRLRERDLELRATTVDGKGLRAIGVLGNDVHDKLLVLQALQPEFPHAIFFTTDLDARFLHPREQAWTRNLLVASSFGLRLNDGLQSGTPPFRDSYQTATYFATLLALARDNDWHPVEFGQNQVGHWLLEPRVFEIGRSRAFDFSAPAPGSRQARSPSCRNRELTACADIHPPGTPRYPDVSYTAVALAASAVLLLTWLPALALSRSLRRRLRRFVARGGSAPGRVKRRALLGAAVLVLQLAIPWILASWWRGVADWLTKGGKPISFDEGISIWPTEAIHLITLMLCLYLVFRGFTALTRNLDQIGLALRLGKTRRRLEAEQKLQDRSLAWWQRLANMFSTHPIYVGPATAELPGDEHMTPASLTFWKFYIVQNRTSSRFMRSLACVLLVLGLCALLFFALHESLGLPRRGSVSGSVHLALGIATVVVMNFLVFYVADATLFCVRFVRELRTRRAHWPERTHRFFASQAGWLPPVLLDHWIDLQFVVRRTECVTGMIYYPFIVLSLLLLSRSSVFDDWHLPIAVALMVLISVAVVLASAVALRLAAENSRKLALEDVDDALLRAKSSQAGPQPATAQLEELRRRIEDLNEGAFAPFSKQPLLKAVLLPFATFGGTTLLEYLALANI